MQNLNAKRSCQSLLHSRNPKPYLVSREKLDPPLMCYVIKRKISPNFMMRCTSLPKSTPQLSIILGCYKYLTRSSPSPKSGSHVQRSQGCHVTHRRTPPTPSMNSSGRWDIYKTETPRGEHDPNIPHGIWGSLRKL
jgi:hypothetical protein